MPELTYTLVITDQGTATIKKVQAGLHGVGQAGQQVGTQTTHGARQAHAELSQLDRTLQRLQRTAAAFLGMWVLTKFLQLPRALVETAFEFNSAIETAKLGIASILMAQGEFNDSVGQSVRGYEKLIAAQQMSGELVRQLQIDNLKTIATFDQLVKAFQSTIAPAIEKGFSVEQTRKFTVAMVQAAGAMGLNLDMLAEETRSLLRGVISPRQTLIATALGITNADIRRFQGNADQLFGYLMKRLDSFQIAGVESQKTWAGVTSNLKDMVKVVLGAGFEDLFQFIKQEAMDLQNYIIKINEATGEWEINPDVLETVKEIANFMGSMYLTLKDAVALIGEGLAPLGTMMEMWKTISISADAYRKALGGGGAGRGSAEARREVEKILGEPLKEPEGLHARTAGKNIFQTITLLLRELNKEMAKTVMPDEYKDFYQRQKEALGKSVEFKARAREITEDELDYLTKVATETGYINDALVKSVQEKMALQGIDIKLADYSRQQLEAVLKTTTEYGKLKMTGKETADAFGKLLEARLRIADIQMTEAPLKIAANLAQQMELYDLQKYLLNEINTLEMDRLRITGQLTPELEKQMKAQAQFQSQEIDKARQLAGLGRREEILGMREEYAKMTGDLEAQLDLMDKIQKLELDRLFIELQFTANDEKRKDIWEKINALMELSAKKRAQAQILGEREQRAPVLTVGLGVAEATGNIVEYERISRMILTDEIDTLRATQSKNKYIEELIKLKEKEWEIAIAIAKAEQETYAGDMIAQAKANYASMTGDMGMMTESSKILLDNEMKRLTANRKLSDDQREILEYYLTQVQASENYTRNLEKQKEILGYHREIAVLQGDYLKSKELEIAMMEKERQLLLEANKNNWEAVQAINEYYEILKRIAEARKNLDVMGLMEIGGQRAAMEAHENLADLYENILPNSVNLFIDSLRNADGTAKSFFDNMKEGFKKMLLDIGFAIVKMQLLRALFGPGGGGGGLFGLLSGLFGGAAGSLTSGLFNPGATAAYAENGGIFNKPTLVWLGEKNKPEAVIPLDKMKAGDISLSMPINIDSSRALSEREARVLRAETEKFVIEKLKEFGR